MGVLLFVDLYLPLSWVYPCWPLAILIVYLCVCGLVIYKVIVVNVMLAAESSIGIFVK